MSTDSASAGSFPAESAPPVPASTLLRWITMFRVLVQLPKLALTIIENQAQIAKAFQSHTAILSQLNARVSWYENRVPFIRKEYFAFKEQERQAIQKVQASIDYEEREKRRAEMAVVE